MRRQRSNQGERAAASRHPAARTEDVLVRNHDFQWGYDLDLAVEDRTGDSIFEERYYLQPGATRSEVGILRPGEYAVRAVLDNDREATARCAVGADPASGILVEVGNGAVSVHDGLFG